MLGLQFAEHQLRRAIVDLGDQHARFEPITLRHRQVRDLSGELRADQ